MLNSNSNKVGLMPAWKKGMSGNPKGRPPKALDSLSKNARSQLMTAFGRKVIRNIDQGLDSDNEKVRMDYTRMVLDKIAPNLQAVKVEIETLEEIPPDTKVSVDRIMNQFKEFQNLALYKGEEKPDWNSSS